MEYFLIHEARYKKILREIRGLGELQGKKLKILDVGCFPYHLGAALEKLGHEVWGISSTHEPIKNKKVAILNIEIDSFPYKDTTFDLVLCSEVLEHLPRSPMPALKEMYRVAKPSGHVLITTPNINGSIHLILRIFGRAPLSENEENVYHRHNHEYTLGELSGVVTNAGWKVTRAKHFISYHPFRRRNKGDNPLLWTGKFANFLLMLALPRLRDTLLVIGAKEA
ncbi:MAG: methyltransferase domain-containing protein [Candidatus Gottesmanbacteria bacterium]|nr:methyltransferase domain-containing protein [Candidatus Gottesmanbacteria bacterium]